MIIHPYNTVTLRAWRAQWEQNKDAIVALGYSERFWRKYRFYFAYCEAGFDARYIHNFQVVFTKLDEGANDTLSNEGTQVPGKVDTAGTPTTDYSLQLLLSVYFFLAGMFVGLGICVHALHAYIMPMYPTNNKGAMVSTKPLLLAVPASSALFAALQPVAMSVYIAVQLCLLGATAGAWLLLQQHMTTAMIILRIAICVAAGYCGFGLWRLVRGGQKPSKDNIFALVLQLVVFGVSAYKGAGCSALVSGAIGGVGRGVPAALAWIVSAGLLLGHDGVLGLLAAGSVLVASVHAFGW